jgi:hypothetical protein
VTQTEPPADESAPFETLPPIPKRSVWVAIARSLRSYFLGEDPTLITALLPTCLLSMVLYTRPPRTNFIFDEQEALLANPYVRAGSEAGKIGWLQAFRRDFWGLPPDRTIGSYRPLPDILWRALWKLGARDQTAFPHAYLNVLLHGLNGALLVVLVFRLTRDRLTAWVVGLLFVGTAVVTEAVSGVVGLADVLGGTGALLALLALCRPARTMAPALFGATLLGLFSKESALCVVPLAPLAALLTAQMTHPARPLRWARAALAALVTATAFALYVVLRRRWFPVVTPADLSVQANAGRSVARRAFAFALRWYAQPILPHDPLNNPLITASVPYRIAGALRVFARGLGQVLVPATLSGDYSAPQEPVPTQLVFPESVLGAAALVAPILVCPWLGFTAWARSRRDAPIAPIGANELGPVPIDSAPLVGFAMAWIVISYLPVSNILILLPTVRAERFWYFPAVGSAILLGIGFVAALRSSNAARVRGLVVVGIVLFAGFQCVKARLHALDYESDLTFWNATRKAVPRSAKAHLNYSVMLGARGDLPGRLESNAVALRLAPQWPMANVYMGDTLCRLHRGSEALPHYLTGFSLGSSDLGLIALGLQCLWDEKQLDEASTARAELQDLADQYPGSWLKYLVDDTFANGDEYQGVYPIYRPRGYNEGPKKDE